MAVPLNAGQTGFNSVELIGYPLKIGAESFSTLLTDGSGNVLLATGTTVPTDAGAGFAKGCLFIDTDVATGTTGLNCNKGTTTSCQFTAITQA